MVMKTIRLTKKQMEKLKEISEMINKNNSYCSTTQLIRDSIDLFLEKDKKEIVEEYSNLY
jgi:hypothetical protein